MAYFDVSADAYVRFMGRFSTHLSEPFAELGLAGVAEDARVLDVGCGPGMLTAELVRRQGEERTAAVDPVESFVSATASSYPSADVRRATAEDLPFADGEFAAVLAQLVVH
ncbi:MAG TPA: class I SAM-dependent methyltransferase, partial [Nocardioides sp.]|nr:class I SAM-dependent methyltransferase [Nocardioides sp.]